MAVVVAMLFVYHGCPSAAVLRLAISISFMSVQNVHLPAAALATKMHNAY
jgi:hypothetical protein